MRSLVWLSATEKRSSGTPASTSATVLDVLMSPEAKSWWDDLKEYLRLLAVPIIVFPLFSLMRLLHMNEMFIDTLQGLDEVAAVLITACFLIGAVRKAAAKAFARSKLHDEST